MPFVIKYVKARKINFRRHCYQNPLELAAGYKISGTAFPICRKISLCSFEEHIQCQPPAFTEPIKKIPFLDYRTEHFQKNSRWAVFYCYSSGLAPGVQTVISNTVSKCHKNDWLRNPTCGHPSVVHQAANSIPSCFNNGQILLEKKTEDFLIRLHTIGQPPDSLGQKIEMMIYMLPTFLTRVLHLKFLQDSGKLTGDFFLFLFKSHLLAFKPLQAVQKVDTHLYLSILNLLMLQCSNLQEPYSDSKLVGLPI